jgi:hypothetical protein
MPRRDDSRPRRTARPLLASDIPVARLLLAV